MKVKTLIAACLATTCLTSVAEARQQNKGFFGGFFRAKPPVAAGKHYVHHRATKSKQSVTYHRKATTHKYKKPVAAKAKTSVKKKVASKSTKKRTKHVSKAKAPVYDRAAIDKHNRALVYRDSSPNPVQLAKDATSGVISGGGALIKMAMNDLGTNPTGWKSKWCAVSLNQWLKQSGHRGTGSPAAASFLGYGTKTHARPGAIAVMNHHVGIVKEVHKGYVVVISGNSRGRKVAITKYSMNRIKAFRSPA